MVKIIVHSNVWKRTDVIEVIFQIECKIEFNFDGYFCMVFNYPFVEK